MEFDYDIIVIWAGSGWLTAAIWLAGAWKKVAMIEKWLIGWDCTNFGCVPSKALIDVAKHNPGISFEVSVDSDAQITWKKIIISTWSKPVIHTIEGLKKEDILTNENVFELKKSIQKLIVIWGGYIGCELAESTTHDQKRL